MKQPGKFRTVLMLMKNLSKVILLAFIVVAGAEAFSQNSAIANDELELLERARRAPSSESWAKLSGKISHRKRGGETEEHDIYLGIRFTPQMIFAQIIIDNVEAYTVSQSFSSKRPTIIKDGDAASRILERVGIRPEELTLSFLYWEPKKFRGNKTFKASMCAEFEMISSLADEKAVVLINREHAFPLKVEWFKGDDKNPARTMEVASFKKENNYWFVDEILIYGPGWRTKIVFSESEAGAASDGIPPDLFRKISPYLE